MKNIKLKSLIKEDSKLDKEPAKTMKIVKDAVYDTWSQIAHDIRQSTKPKDLTNYSAIEVCLDADNLVNFGNNKQADKIVQAFVDRYGYKQTIDFLSKHIKLV